MEKHCRKELFIMTKVDILTFSMMERSLFLYVKYNWSYDNFIEILPREV